MHATGGLADSVVDSTPATLADGTASGFAFTGATVDALHAAAGRCVASWRDAREWKQLQRNAMSRDFGWSTAASQYRRLYESLLAAGAARQ